jgi:uncharacterized protein
MHQSWEHLLFLHWSWEPEAVQQTLPPGLRVDVFNGRAWIGLVPFFMCNVRPTFTPALPHFSNFLEVNLRTYVYDAEGRPGVWFYSLDCNRWLVVKGARAAFHLLYQHAEMRATVDSRGQVDYYTRRRGEERESRFQYRATGEGRLAVPGSEEFFLIERYALFAHDPRRAQLWLGRVAHPPYRIRDAEVQGWDDGLLRLAGFDVQGRAPEHICVADAVDVEIFSPSVLKNR